MHSTERRARRHLRCCPLVCAGHWGADCSLSMGAGGKPVLLAPGGPDEKPYLPRAAGPRIYVYELPVNLTTW